MFDVTVEKKNINTVISCWVGNSMETEGSGFPADGARGCADRRETTGPRSSFLSHPMNYNHPCSCQQWRMSWNSDMGRFGYAACQDRDSQSP